MKACSHREVYVTNYLNIHVITILQQTHLGALTT